MKISFLFQNEFSSDDTFGLMWVLTQLIKNKQSSLLGSTVRDQILVRQWSEYAATHLCLLNNLSLYDVHTILKVSIMQLPLQTVFSSSCDFTTDVLFQDLNEVLSDRVYFAGNKLTLADLVFYYMTYTTIVSSL